jgi:hypothetical protein
MLDLVIGYAQHAGQPDTADLAHAVDGNDAAARRRDNARGGRVKGSPPSRNLVLATSRPCSFAARQTHVHDEALVLTSAGVPRALSVGDAGGDPIRFHQRKHALASAPGGRTGGSQAPGSAYAGHAAKIGRTSAPGSV